MVQEVEKMWDQYGLEYSALVVTNRATNSIKELVGVNLLRYQSDGSVTYHSKLVYNFVKEFVPTVLKTKLQ